MPGSPNKMGCTGSRDSFGNAGDTGEPEKKDRGRNDVLNDNRDAEDHYPLDILAAIDPSLNEEINQYLKFISVLYGKYICKCLNNEVHIEKIPSLQVFLVRLFLLAQEEGCDSLRKLNSILINDSLMKTSNFDLQEATINKYSAALSRFYSSLIFEPTIFPGLIGKRIQLSEKNPHRLAFTADIRSCMNLKYQLTGMQLFSVLRETIEDKRGFNMELFWEKITEFKISREFSCDSLTEATNSPSPLASPTTTHGAGDAPDRY